jgi:hypothetical protein
MRRTTLLIAAMALASCASAQTYPAKVWIGPDASRES